MPAGIMVFWKLSVIYQPCNLASVIAYRATADAYFDDPAITSMDGQSHSAWVS